MEEPRFQLLPAGERGRIDLGWQEIHCQFSFDEYRNPARAGFGGLLALNEHRLLGGAIEDALPVRDVCVLLLPLAGAIEYRDNTPAQMELIPGQCLSVYAGSGVVYGLANPSSLEPASYLTFWFLARLRDGDPRVALIEGPGANSAGPRNKFRLLAAPDEREGALWLNQDALLACAELDAGRTLAWTVADENFLDRGAVARRGLYLFVIQGSLRVSAQADPERPARKEPVLLEASDGLAIEGAAVVHLTASVDCRFALIETALPA